MKAAIPLTLGALLALGACSSTDADLKACPPKGIGVEDHNGVSVAEQIAQAHTYNCSEPQICPDIGGKSVGFGVDPNAAKGQVSFILTNCGAKAKLEIQKIEVWGDSRCFFSNVTDADIQPGRSANPRENIAIKTDYLPTAVGEDHAELRVYSNAQNFPVLRLRVCGLAFNPQQGNPDAGPVGDGGPPDLGEADLTTGLQCRAVDTQPSCHQ